MFGFSWRRGKASLFSACLWAAVAVAAEPSAAATYLVKVIREPAGIRNEGGERILDLQKDDVLSVMEEAEGNTYKVKTLGYGQTVGYINRDLVRKIAEQPTATAKGAAPAASAPPEKSWLGRNWGWVVAGAAVGGGAIALASSSSGGGDDGESGEESLTGTWSGTSATGQVDSTLVLTQNGNAVSGSLHWPRGDTRSVSGSVSGSSVTLYVEGGDIWNMDWTDNTLLGTAQKYGGGSYALSFSR